MIIKEEEQYYADDDNFVSLREWINAQVHDDFFEDSKGLSEMSTDDAGHDIAPFKVESFFRDKKAYVKKSADEQVVKKAPLNHRFAETIA